MYVAHSHSRTRSYADYMHSMTWYHALVPEYTCMTDSTCTVPVLDLTRGTCLLTVHSSYIPAYRYRSSGTCARSINPSDDRASSSVNFITATSFARSRQAHCSVEHSVARWSSRFLQQPACRKQTRHSVTYSFMVAAMQSALRWLSSTVVDAHVCILYMYCYCYCYCTGDT